jgi:HSP20 family protein
LFDFGREDKIGKGYRSRISRYPTAREDRSEQEWFRSGMGNMVRMYGDDLPKEFQRLVKDTMGPKGDVRQRVGPFVYGFTYTFNPAQSEPLFSEFGNVRASGRGLELSEGRTPVVDVRDLGDSYRVEVELPGVSKQDVRLDVGEDSMEVRTLGDRKFFTRTALFTPVDPGSAKATCSNGVLSIDLKKKVSPEKEGTDINIE